MTTANAAGWRRRFRALICAQVVCVLVAATVLLWVTREPAPATAVVASQETADLPPSAPSPPRRAPVQPAPARPAPVEPPPGPEITLAFGGDVHFERGIAKVLARNPSAVLGDAAAPLRAADVAVVNLETAVGRGGTAAPKQYVFRAPSGAFAALRDAGIDVVSMANNHALDYGRASLVDAVDTGAAAGVPVIGAGRDADQAFRPYVTTVEGQRVTVLAATQVLDSSLAAAWTATPRQAGMASAKNPARLLRAVREARQAGGVVAVYLHWGVEREQCPPLRAKRLARQLVDAGADVIVGTHAHVPLADGHLGGAYVHYGLGNLLWYTGDTVQGGVVTLTLRGRTVTDTSWMSIRMRGPKPVAARDPGLSTAARSCAGLTDSPAP